MSHPEVDVYWLLTDRELGFDIIRKMCSWTKEFAEFEILLWDTREADDEIAAKLSEKMKSICLRSLERIEHAAQLTNSESIDTEDGRSQYESRMLTRYEEFLQDHLRFHLDLLEMLGSRFIEPTSREPEMRSAEIDGLWKTIKSIRAELVATAGLLSSDNCEPALQEESTEATPSA